MTGVLSSAEHRQLFQRAVRENITMAEARRRTAEERWAASDRRLAEKRCGTRIDVDACPAPRTPFWWEQL